MRKMKNTCVLVCHSNNTTLCVCFTSGSTDKRTSLGKCATLSKPLPRRGIWKSKSSSGGNFFILQNDVCLMLLRVFQNSNFSMMHIKWALLNRYEITVIVRMRIFDFPPWITTGCHLSILFCDTLQWLSGVGSQSLDSVTNWCRGFAMPHEAQAHACHFDLLAWGDT